MTARPTLEEAHAVMAARLGGRSLAHCERVSETAARIAAAYGADPEAAGLAGLLHDRDRDEDDAGLLEAAERHGLGIDDVERARPYLLHSRTAAEELRSDLPGISEEVLEAVEAHTLGSDGMSDLAKVVYVADMIEPARDWDGVEELREAVGEVDLGELFTRAYQVTLAHVVAKRRRIHPRALEVWNSLVGERQR